MQPTLRRTQRRALIGPPVQASDSRDYGDSPTTRTPLLSDAKIGVTRTTPKPLDKHEIRGIRPRSIALASGPRRRVVGPMDAHLLANTRLVGNMQVFTPIVEEPPDPVEGQPSASPAAQAPPSLPPARPTSEQPSHNGFYYFKDVVDAQARGDIQAASAAFKAINKQLGNLPKDSPEKADIFAECGLHLLLEARRCKAQGQPDDARTKAQRAVDCLETSVKLQTILSLPVKPHHHLWLGWIHEFSNKKKKAHKAYEDGIAACSVNDGLAFELRMAQIELYTEEPDWDGCWRALVVALNTWPTVPDLYARAGLTILRRDYATNPVAALQGALIWYRSASELAPTNSYYILCISRVNEQLSRLVHVPDPSMLENDGTPPVMPPFSPPPPPPPNNFLDLHSRNSMSSALTYSEYGHVLPPSQRQFVGMEEVLNCQSPLPQQSRPQSVAPVMQPFPAGTELYPSAPEAWQLPSPSLRSRSVISSPGPSTQKHRRFSGSHRTRGLLNKVHDAVKSIHEVARAVTPLRERVRETQEALTQQYDQLQGRVEELHHKQDSIEQTLSRRISNAELGIQELKAASPPPHSHRHQPHSDDMEDLARRAQSVPPQQRFNAANLSQDDLLERSIMLYGVWALEKRLGK